MIKSKLGLWIVLEHYPDEGQAMDGVEYKGGYSDEKAARDAAKIYAEKNKTYIYYVARLSTALEHKVTESNITPLGPLTRGTDADLWGK